MDNLDKYIDGMFHDKLSGAESSGVYPDMEWLRLRNTIRSKNFLRFNAGSFNVYYLSFVVSVIVTIGAIVNNNISKKNTPEKHEKNPVVYSDTLGVILQNNLEKDSIIQNEVIIEKKTNVNLQQSPKGNIKVASDTISQANSNLNENLQNKPIQAVKTDTLKVSQPSGAAEKLLVSPPKADSLIITDTVKVIKKQIKFQRKSN